MKGLIIKDIYTLRQQAKIYLLMVVLFGATALFSDDASYFIAMVSVFITMLPITALSYDERASWDKYALSMPLSRKDIVLGKYALGGIATIVGGILALGFAFITTGDLYQSGELALLFWVLSVFLFSVLMPAFFKFGVEKGRMVMLAIFFTPVILLLFANSLNLPTPDLERLASFKFMLPLIVLSIAWVSFKLSFKFYQSKEF